MYTRTAQRTTLNGPESLWKRLMTVFTQSLSRQPTNPRVLFLQTDLKREMAKSSIPQAQDFHSKQASASSLRLILTGLITVSLMTTVTVSAIPLPEQASQATQCR